MKVIEKLGHLADRFEVKYAQKGGVQTSQSGTTELFFGSEQNQKSFVAAVQQPDGPLHKILLEYYNKTNGKPASFALTMSAMPNAGARWELTTTPPGLKPVVWKKLNEVYQKIVGSTMEKAQATADAQAKAGAGTGGPVAVGTLDLA